MDVVDDKECARCKKIFRFYDEDRDGKVRACRQTSRACVMQKNILTGTFGRARAQLTYAEVLSALRACGRNPSVEEFKEMVTEVDTKLDGALDFEDFMCLFVSELKDGPNDMKELLEAFQAFDKAGNGFIMSEDLKTVLTTMGKDRLTDEEAQMMVNLADKDGDGVLDYDEIVELITGQAERLDAATVKLEG